MRIESTGHAAFAATMIGLGIMGLLAANFSPIFTPVPKAVPGREVLVYVCAFIPLASGLGLLWRRSSVTSARLLFLYLLLWLIVFKVSRIALAPTVDVYYESWGETAVIVAGAWILYAWFSNEWERRWLGFAVGNRGLRAATVLFGLAMLAFGLAQFFYMNLTAPLIPGWIPWHVGWGYLTGVTYILAGLAVLSNLYARLAAGLATLQMGLFTLLVWVPRIMPDRITHEHWSEFVISWTLTAGGWVVTDSYRGKSWFAVGRQLHQSHAKQTSLSRASPE